MIANFERFLFKKNFFDEGYIPESEGYIPESEGNGNANCRFPYIPKTEEQAGLGIYGKPSRVKGFSKSTNQKGDIWKSERF